MSSFTFSPFRGLAALVVASRIVAVRAQDDRAGALHVLEPRRRRDLPDHPFH